MKHRDRLVTLAIGILLGSLGAWWLTRESPSTSTSPDPVATRDDPSPERDKPPTRTGGSGPEVTVIGGPDGQTVTTVEMDPGLQAALEGTLGMTGSGSARHRVATLDQTGRTWIVEGQPSDRVEAPVFSPSGAAVTFRRGSGLFRWTEDGQTAVDQSNGADSWTYSQADALAFSRGGRLYWIHHDAAIELMPDIPGRLTDLAYEGLEPAFVQDGTRLVQYVDGELVTLVEGTVREPVFGVEWCWRLAHAAESDIACQSGSVVDSEAHELRPTWTGTELVWLVMVSSGSYDLAGKGRTVAERVRAPTGPVGASGGWVALASETPGVLELHHVAEDRFVELETGRADATDPDLHEGRLAFASGPDLVVVDVSELLQASVDAQPLDPVAP